MDVAKELKEQRPSESTTVCAAAVRVRDRSFGALSRALNRLHIRRRPYPTSAPPLLLIAVDTLWHNPPDLWEPAPDSTYGLALDAICRMWTT